MLYVNALALDKRHALSLGRVLTQGNINYADPDYAAPVGPILTGHFSYMYPHWDPPFTEAGETPGIFPTPSQRPLPGASVADSDCPRKTENSTA